MSTKKMKSPPLGVPSRVRIEPSVIRRLWARSAGHCQYIGCTVNLYRDDLTQRPMNNAYVAHIVAAEPNGPRGNEDDSPRLADEYSNLMLLCDTHHRLIDREGKDDHGIDMLQAMKENNEDRIELLVKIPLDKKSHIVLFGTNIGSHLSPLNPQETARALLPQRFPAAQYPIKLSLEQCAFEDGTKEFWDANEKNLQLLFKERVELIRQNNKEAHFSIFALAPMPLLIKLGVLMGEIFPADVYQLIREPRSWVWQDEDSNIDFEIIPPTQSKGAPVLVISLSATITNERIEEVVNEEHSIWTLTIPQPHNDFLRCKSLLSKFRVAMRTAFDQIKTAHGQKQVLHIFPAMPISAAIELGRVWMPKADLSMKIWDQNKKQNSFTPTITIQ